MALVTHLLPRRCGLAAALVSRRWEAVNEDNPIAYQLLTCAALSVWFLLSSQGHQEQPGLRLHMIAGLFKLLVWGLFAPVSAWLLKPGVVYVAPSD